MPPKYRAPTVIKAIEMLKAISRSNQGLGISELAKELNISKGTVHGVTLALEEMGVVVRDPLTKKFSIGYAIIEMGARGLRQMPLREAARGPMTSWARAFPMLLGRGGARDSLARLSSRSCSMMFSPPDSGCRKS